MICFIPREIAVIRAAPHRAEAVAAYREAFPTSRRTDGAIRSKWSRMNRGVEKGGHPKQPDVPGVPSIDWIQEAWRCNRQQAAQIRGNMNALVLAHGLGTVLAEDIVDLADLWGPGRGGTLWDGRRRNARLAHKVLLMYHGAETVRTPEEAMA